MLAVELLLLCLHCFLEDLLLEDGHWDLEAFLAVLKLVARARWYELAPISASFAEQFVLLDAEV